MDFAQLDELKEIIDLDQENVVNDYKKFIRFLFLVTSYTGFTPGITQKELARQIKIGESPFSLILNGRSTRKFTLDQRIQTWNYCINERHLKEDVDKRVLTKTEQFEVDFYTSFRKYYDITDLVTAHA